MKCEHGNEVSVEVQSFSNVCWDSGIEVRKADGELHDKPGGENEEEYLMVFGCPICKFVKGIIPK